MAKEPRAEIAIVGDVDDWEADVIKQLLELPPGAKCVFYIDSGGGSVYGALAVITLLRHRQLEASAIVLGECSSASLLLFAACSQRLVTKYSTLMFHRMRWQSEKRVAAVDAVRWARHFDEMERDIDDLQARLFGKAADQLKAWTDAGCYVTGPEIVAAGLAELLEI